MPFSWGCYRSRLGHWSVFQLLEAWVQGFPAFHRMEFDLETSSSFHRQFSALHFLILLSWCLTIVWSSLMEKVGRSFVLSLKMMRHIRKMGSELRLVQVCLKLPEATWRLPEPQRLKDTKLLSEKVDKFTRVLKDSRVALSSLENLWSWLKFFFFLFFSFHFGWFR